MTLLGEDSWKLVPGFLWTSPHAAFSLADFSLNSFAVLNHSYEYSYMLNPVSPSSELSNQTINGLKSGDTLNEIGILKDE